MLAVCPRSGNGEPFGHSACFLDMGISRTSHHEEIKERQFSPTRVLISTMPRKDVYHDVVIQALVVDGWTITHDPLPLSYGGKDVYVDLGAAQPIGAEKADRRIAVEIKSFLGPSDVHELEVAIGQYALYLDILSEVEPARVLYLAVSQRVSKGIFTDPLGQLVLARQQLQRIIFDDLQARILRWIP